jgi:hypothetical protein
VSYFGSKWAPALPEPRRSAARAQLEEVVRQSVTARRFSRKSKWIISGSALLCVTVVACTVAVAATLNVPNKTQARCYTVDKVAGFHVGIGMASRSAKPGQVRNARSVCAALYRAGNLKAGVAGINPKPGSGNHRVPPLAACVLPDGTAGVFPGGPGTCARLGLPRARTSGGAT